MRRALFVGRFQPFHKGHEYALNYILSKEDEVIIAIGSSQENFTLKNPLTAGERVEIIWYYLKKKGLTNRVLITVIPDINNNRLWPHHVIALVPNFHKVYSGNKLVLLLFRAAGYDVEEIVEIDKSKLSGTNIRKRILNNEDWEYLVPKPVLEKLREFRFDERLRKLIEIYH